MSDVRSFSFPAIFLALGWGLAACGGGAGPVGFDAGLDSGPIGEDGGATDAGDDGGGTTDAGDDAGVMTDAAMTDGGAMTDAGVMTDAGGDAGALTDGGAMTDGGATSDAAMTDGGAMTDAGPPACGSDSDCPPVVSCSSATELTTQTFACSGGACVENAPTRVDCAASDSDTCSADSVVATRGSCDSASLSCVNVDTVAACAAPACDATSDYVTETCSAASGSAVCVGSTSPCDAGTTTSCRRAVRVENVRGCDPSAGCSINRTNSACTAGGPACVTDPGGVTSYVTYAPACNAAGTDCQSGGAVDTSTPCLARRNRCVRGALTSYTSTCDPSTGCGIAVTRSPCRTRPNSCSAAGGALTFTTYSPTCATPSACNPTGTAVDTLCTTSPATCTAAGYTAYTATCGTTTGCGETRTTDDCANYSTCTRSRWSVRYGGGRCTDAGCTGTEQSLSCVRGGSICTGRRTSVTCPPGGVCGGSSCSGCTVTPCSAGCASSTGECIRIITPL
ncbi:MAG: hypothetical protein GXP55_09720 [Deltaproteobacteria bacterium]|nr:hypothetical protein [Deltaproteobacteria bacterium]